jgi:hypothetical protein
MKDVGKNQNICVLYSNQWVKFFSTTLYFFQFFSNSYPNIINFVRVFRNLKPGIYFYIQTNTTNENMYTVAVLVCIL